MTKDSAKLRALPVGVKFRVEWNGTTGDYVRDFGGVRAIDDDVLGQFFEFERFDGYEDQRIVLL